MSNDHLQSGHFCSVSNFDPVAGNPVQVEQISFVPGQQNLTQCHLKDVLFLVADVFVPPCRQFLLRQWMTIMTEASLFWVLERSTEDTPLPINLS